ncbi:envelope stress response membrane protein PspB [Idiomarina sp. A28L]|uniref:envelope stress response membrane protein PspB n=1 Tax=Idiomarina sp. A28L TaxID=1036674 RepID=UPI0002EEE4B2|nr:envelope stress response membrane protein PspB [Idiomarina sp. A28L]
MDVAVISMLIAPLILFVIFVAPIWVILHYRSRNKISEGMSQEDAERVRDLAQQAERMRDRIRTLENLLDAEHSNWRQNDRG